jgi:tetratricopeptide (TPR) repeat protein
VLLYFAVFSVSSAIAEQYTFSKSDTPEVVISLSGLITEHYVFPEIAERAATLLNKRLDSGAYANAESADQLSQMLSMDLQSISRDGHLTVRPLAARIARPSDYDPEVEQLVRRREEKLENYGLEKVEVLEGNVGYLKMTHFSGHDSAKETVAAMKSFLSNVDALIVDMRDNIGGNSDMHRYFSSYFLEPGTLLRKAYSRGSNEAQELRTLDRPPKHKMYDVPLYILIGSGTASAAEAFAFTLQEYERCIVVGESTAGLAGAGKVFRLDPSYKVFISTKHIVGPFSEKNWSETGVIPDLESTAEAAFDKAYEKAAIAATEFGSAKMNAIIADIQESVKKLIHAAGQEDDYQLGAMVKVVLDDLQEKWAMDETAVNDMGYRYLQQHDSPAIAKHVFAYNRDTHPDSGNAYSSLADAYSELGMIDLAIKNYNLALRIDPGDAYAQEMLRRQSREENDE